MNSRAILLDKLIVNGHVSVAERKALGTVSKQEVAEIVKTHLQIDGAFPGHRGSEAVYEGATLTKVPSGVEITWERAYAWDPFTVAERRIEIFEDVDTAIHEFIESEWKAGIDGIQLV